MTLRIDRDVLDYYQANGPGWQERINRALRKAAGKQGRNNEVYHASEMADYASLVSQIRSPLQSAARS